MLQDKSGYDTFEILREDLHSNLISMFEEKEEDEDDAMDNATTADAAKTLYNSCMDTGGSGGRGKAIRNRGSCPERFLGFIQRSSRPAERPPC